MRRTGTLSDPACAAPAQAALSFRHCDWCKRPTYGGEARVDVGDAGRIQAQSGGDQPVARQICPAVQTPQVGLQLVDDEGDLTARR